jgi:hypothetical protein
MPIAAIRVLGPRTHDGDWSIILLLGSTVVWLGAVAASIALRASAMGIVAVVLACPPIWLFGLAFLAMSQGGV